jgi:hypothetical protein
MTNNTRTLERGHLIKLQLGRLCITYVKAERENAISVSELERLETIRKLKEESKSRKLSRTDIVIEEITFRKY